MGQPKKAPTSRAKLKKPTAWARKRKSQKVIQKKKEKKRRGIKLNPNRISLLYYILFTVVLDIYYVWVFGYELNGTPTGTKQTRGLTRLKI